MAEAKVYRLNTSTKMKIRVKMADGTRKDVAFTGGTRQPQFRAGRAIIKDEATQKALESHPEFNSTFLYDPERTHMFNNPEATHKQRRKTASTSPIANDVKQFKAEPSKKGAGAKQAAEDAKVIEAALAEESVEESMSKKVTLAPEDITTVQRAGKWLRDNYDGVKAKEVNTVKGILEVAEGLGVEFPNIKK